MKFPGEGFGWKSPKSEERSDAEWDLEEENRRLKDERNLAEMHIEYLGDEKKKMDGILGLHEMHRELLEDEKKKLGKQVENLGIDGLTGALRREIFETEIDRILPMIKNEKEERRGGVDSYREACLIFIDIDKFKNVNDTYGHDVGDVVLRRIAILLKETLRDTDLLGRYGGDEFIAFLSGTAEKNAIEIANKLRAKIDEDIELNRYATKVTGSFGVCSTNVSTADDAKNFMKHADEAAYLAKEAGGNQVRVYT